MSSALNQTRPQPHSERLPPSHQPWDATTKNIYIITLVVIAIVVVGLNMWHTVPTPPPCSTDSSAH